MSTAFNVWTPKGTIVSGGGQGWGNPNVIYDTNPVILTGNTHVFKMWYGDYNNGDLYYAESVDGLTSWTQYSGNPISLAGPVAFMTVWKVGSTYYLYATPGNGNTGTIVLYTSSDGVTSWASQGTALSRGTAGQWDSNNIAQLYLCAFVGGTYYAYYQGGNGAGIFASGLVTSTSPSGPWTKSASNPLINVLNGGVGSGNVFMNIGGTYYCWGDGSYNNSQLATNNFHAIFRWSAPSPSGPWTQLAIGGSQVPVYYPASAADFTSLNVNDEVGDQTMVVANGNIYLYYDVGSAGSEGAINQAVATGITPAQLVAGYEGVVGAPISGFPQLNEVTQASDPGTGANANPIGGNWTTTAAGDDLQRVSNLIEPANASHNGTAWWNAYAWGNDHWARGTAAACSSGSDIGVTVRTNQSGVLTLYDFLWSGVLGSSGSWFIQKRVAGTGTTLQTGTGLTVKSGDTIAGVVNGTNLYFYWNGFLIGAISDSSIASGAAGILLFGNGATADAQLSAWSGGSLQAALNGISGSLGAAGAGATVAYSGASSGSVTADGSGNYNTGEVLMPLGTYTITPTKAGATFSPASQNVTLAGADQTGINFTSSNNSTGSGDAGSFAFDYSFG
jgi:hypothetical protein